jgi:GH15 family glucan-1,4-alpha-glucosidase
MAHRLNEQGIKVCYTLEGKPVPSVDTINLPGYEKSQPVVTGNAAGTQHQHGVYGDIFQSASLFVEAGSILDQNSVSVLSRIADECADRWRQPDSGIWELEELQHYTMSKISCWQALFRAVQLAEKGHLSSTRVARWSRERDRIEFWVNEHCWSERMQAFTFYPGTDRLDASMTLEAYFGFPHAERLSLMCSAIQRTCSMVRGSTAIPVLRAKREHLSVARSGWRSLLPKLAAGLRRPGSWTKHLPPFLRGRDPERDD